MSTQSFACTSEAASLNMPIVLLNGWMMPADMWQSLLPILQTVSDVIVIDESYDGCVDTVCDKITQQLPERSVLIGWSLGGMLATRIAIRSPPRVRALVTLASNMQFVADEQYTTAMAEEVYENFYQAYSSAPEKTLQQFSRLVVQGDEYIREQKRYIKQYVQNIPLFREDGQAGLHLLSRMKKSELSTPICCPSLHIFGKHDHLVPVVAAENMAVLGVASVIEILSDAGHLLHYPAERIAPILQRFFTRLAIETVSGD